MCNLVAIGLSFVLDWVKEWRELSRPITDHNKLKPNKPFWIHFDPELTFFFKCKSSCLFSQIKCYHKNTLSSGRDIIFRCQFHTGAVRDYGLELDKTELDDACKGMYLMFLIGLKNTQALRHSRPPPKWRPK